MAGELTQAELDVIARLNMPGRVEDALGLLVQYQALRGRYEKANVACEAAAATLAQAQAAAADLPADVVQAAQDQADACAAARQQAWDDSAGPGSAAAAALGTGWDVLIRTMTDRGFSMSRMELRDVLYAAAQRPATQA